MGKLSDKKQLQQAVIRNLRLQFGKTVETATPLQRYKAVAQTVRDKIMGNWANSPAEQKTVCYLSMEYLTGKFLGSNLLALGEYDFYRGALAEMGLDLEELEAMEREPGLGNGGLGRLAACFMESLSTMGLPAIGCGIRYDLGLFRQKIVENEQTELTDHWLADGCVWEVPRPEESFEINFYGKLESYIDHTGRLCFTLKDATRVIATPYDIPVCGYENHYVNTLRLWSARSPDFIDMRSFSQGEYLKASAERELAETISRVLYPNDSHNEGKSLRLRQQYFFTSATLQYLLKRHKDRGLPLSALPEKLAIQINDTHPAIAVAEMMRLLLDQERMGWDEAWEICTWTFSYTNHTVMSEALETWPEYLMQNLLPRIYQIIQEIDRRFRRRAAEIGGEDLAQRTAILNYGTVRMANMCMATCHRVNGVSGLHTEILKSDLFADFQRMNPGQIMAVTNGISPRRWLLQANPALCNLITETLGGNAWKKDLTRIADLEKFESDKVFLEKLNGVKALNKQRLCNFLARTQGVSIDPETIFDVQVKRLHEYKRQLLNALRILYLYFDIVENDRVPARPYTFLFGAKASPGYRRAKQIITLICEIADLIERTPKAAKWLKVVFVENYNVNAASYIIPAADISQQISMAGKEASGTGNMKFMMNGALTIGTRDGANVEMSELLGEENMFLFGLTADRVNAAFRYGRIPPEQQYGENLTLRRTIDAMGDGTLPDSVASLRRYLLQGDGCPADPYLCIADFADYMAAHERAAALYQDQWAWGACATRNIARSHFFSSDRAIETYNQSIWHLRV